MYKRIDIIDYHFDRDDIDYAILEETARRYANDVNIPNQPFKGVIVSEKVYNKACQIASSQQNEYDAYLTNKTLQKWMGPQGGSFTQNQLEFNLPEYYATRNTGTYDDDWYRTFLNMVEEGLRESKYTYHIEGSLITESAVDLYHLYKGDHRSAQGITGKGDRRKPENRAKAISQAKKNPTCFDPAIAGMRLKDGKYRNIYIDSFANYFREARIYAKLFSWLEHSPWDNHYSDKELSRIVTTLNAAYHYGSDLKGMDYHESLTDATHVIDETQQLLHLDKTECNYIKFCTEELFTNDLIAGSKVYQGLHNLFSGIYPTHNLEGYRNLFKAIYLIKKHGFHLIGKIRKLKKREAFILVCGDDLSIFFGSKPENVNQLKNDDALASQYFGHEMEISKVDESTTVAQFCKKTLALRRDVPGFKHFNSEDEYKDIPVWKGPTLKGVHALYMPENIPSFPDKRGLIVWFCTIMDCYYGNTSWQSTVIYIVQNNKELFMDIPENPADLVTDSLMSILNEDWWFANYAQFDLPKSPTFKVICKTLGL